MKTVIKGLIYVYVAITIKSLFSSKMWFEKIDPTFIDRFSLIFFIIMFLLMPFITILYKNNKVYIIFIWVITLLLILKNILIFWNNAIWIT